MLQAEKLCLHSALDALIASSISHSADSVILLEQTVLLSSTHQTILDNFVLCELKNIRLADAVDSAGSALLLAPAPCPSAATFYRVLTCRCFSPTWNQHLSLISLSAVLSLLLSMIG
jgi:hypothetical protein